MHDPVSGEPVVIGVDVATATVRAMAVTPGGTPLAIVSAPLPALIRERPGWSQQRPDYRTAVFAALRRLTRDPAVVGRGVFGLSVSATSGTIVPCDEAGEPTGDALLYDDRRGAALVSAEVLAAAPALAAVAWLARHRAAARYLHASDVVVTALTGEPAITDTSHGLKTGADPESGRWSARLLGAAGVDAERLPVLAAPGTRVGVLRPAVARDTGLPGGTPVLLGMTDGCTGQLAAGAVAPGDGVGVLGTTLVLKTVGTEWVSALDGAVYSHRAPDGLWWPGGASNAGAGVLAETVTGDLREWDAAAARNGPAKAVRYPLIRSGERFPFRRDDAEGFWLAESDDPVERFRATLEGVAFVERLGFAVLAEHGAAGRGPIRAVGGGSRSEAWLRIRASVLNRSLMVPAHPVSAFGAAVLAAAATAHRGLREAVGAMVRPALIVDPDSREQPALDDTYHRMLAELTRRGYTAG